MKAIDAQTDGYCMCHMAFLTSKAASSEAGGLYQLKFYHSG